VLWLYSTLAWAAQPLLRRKLRRRAQAEPGYAQHVPERFGHYDSAPRVPQPGEPPWCGFTPSPWGKHALRPSC